MFNLIVTILALVLMIGAAIAGLTYLGPAFTNSQTKATVAAMLNASEQFQGAEALFKSDNGGSYSADLTTSISPYYLSSSPVVPSAFTGSSWALGGTAAVPTVTLALSGPAALAVCTLIKGEVGVTGPYGCDSYTAPTSFYFNL